MILDDGKTTDFHFLAAVGTDLICIALLFQWQAVLPHLRQLKNLQAQHP
jgi:hypothetical protein